MQPCEGQGRSDPLDVVKSFVEVRVRHDEVGMPRQGGYLRGGAALQRFVYPQSQGEPFHSTKDE